MINIRIQHLNSLLGLEMSLHIYLNKEWNSVESSDNYSVVNVSGQNVKCACASLYDLLHTNSLLMATDN